MKKSKVLIILSIMISIICAGCGKAEEKIKSTKDSKTETTKEVKDMGSLMMATTTSTADTGLLDYLAPLFKADTGYTLEWNAVGTGEALKLGEDGIHICGKGSSLNQSVWKNDGGYKRANKYTTNKGNET